MQNFLENVPPVTKLLMIQQLIGLFLQEGNFINQYDIYFNFDKIVYEGQVKYPSFNLDCCYAGLETVHFSLLPQKVQFLPRLRNILCV